MFASGRGTDLQSLLDHGAEAPWRVSVVISNRPEAQALVRARSAGIPAVTIDTDGSDAAGILKQLRSHDAELVVLAGYLKRVPPEVVAAYRGRILNIHPALLPSFGGAGMYGRRVHEAVISSGARVSGVTVHLVDEEYDRGPIIAQWPVPVRSGDTAQSLADRVLATEHRLLPEVVAHACRCLLAGGAVTPLSAAGTAFRVSDDPAPTLNFA